MRDVTDEIPGLSEGERAFEIAEGRHEGRIAVVRVTRREQGEDLVLKVQPLLRDKDGEPVEIGGSPVRPSARTRTVSISALEAGEVEIGDLLTEARSEAVERLMGHATAMEVWG